MYRRKLKSIRRNTAGVFATCRPTRPGRSTACRMPSARGASWWPYIRRPWRSSLNFQETDRTETTPGSAVRLVSVFVVLVALVVARVCAVVTAVKAETAAYFTRGMQCRVHVRVSCACPDRLDHFCEASSSAIDSLSRNGNDIDIGKGAFDGCRCSRASELSAHLTGNHQRHPYR